MHDRMTPTCIRCTQALDQHGEHLLPCAKSGNPEFRTARVVPVRGTGRGRVRAKSAYAASFPAYRDRFEAIREAA